MSPPAPPSLPHKTAWNFASGVALIAGRFGAGLLVARLLGPEAFGRVVYWLWLADIAATCAHLALPASLTRFLAERLGAGDAGAAGALRAWIWRRFLVLAAVGAGVVALASLGSGPRNALLLAAYFFAQSTWTLAQADLAGQGRFSVSAKINVTAGIILLAAVGIGAHLAGANGALAGYLIGVGTAAGAGVVCVGRGKSAAAPGADLRRAIGRFALPTWIAVVLGALVWGRLELFFLERSRSVHEVGLFAVGLSLVTLATQGPVLLADALMPHFASLAGAERHHEVNATYGRATRLIAVLVLPLALGTAAIMPVLLPGIYGDAFRPAVPIASVLVTGAAVQVGVVGGTLIYGLGHARAIAMISAVGAVLGIIAGLSLIPETGAWGAAWARVGIQLGMTAAGFWFVQRRLGCVVPWSAMARAAAAAIACALVARLIVATWPVPLALVPAVIGGALTYVFAVRVLRVLAPDDVAGLTRLAQPLPAAFAGPWSTLVGWLAP